MRALVRGEDVGLSAARYVVAKMLSLSESCGRSIDDLQRVLSWTFGVVLERPVCASVFGVTASCSAAAWEAPWLGRGGVFDLTDAGGEVFLWASDCCDMGPTLVRPSERRPCESVAGRLADIAVAPGTMARMRVVGRGGNTADGQQGRLSVRGPAALGNGQRACFAWCGLLRAASEDCCTRTLTMCGQGAKQTKGAQILEARDG